MSIYHHRGQLLHNGHGPRGQGFGSIISSLFKTIIPVVGRLGKRFITSDIAKSAFKGVKDAAIEGGINLATDALRGDSIEASAKKNLAAARNKIADSVESSLQQKVQTLKRKNKPLNLTTAKRRRGAKVRRRKVLNDLFNE